MPIAQLVAHIDHVCQIIGDARHAGIGSDLDGGFGMRDIPDPMDSIADLPLIGAALGEKGNLIDLLQSTQAPQQWFAAVIDRDIECRLAANLFAAP